MRGAPDGSGPTGSQELLTHWEGEPVRVWERLWRVPHFEAWDRLGSTNDRTGQLARDGALPFTVVIAEEQTSGRGRGGRAWASPPGMGLWMSVVLAPAVPGAALLAPLLVGLATCRAVDAVLESSPARLKWPNDVLLRGRKVAGVLCEGGGKDTLVAGIGVNVRQRESDFPESLQGRAISLDGVAGRAVSRAHLAGNLMREMRGLLSRPVLRLDGALAEEVARRDALAGLRVQVEGGPGGRAVGIDSTGRLSIETASGEIRPVVAGSVLVASAEDIYAGES